MTTAQEFIKSISDGVLEHHGVKGQKWGIRNKRTSKSGASADKPKAQDLSDEDLKKAVSRMQMEKQYSALVGNKSPRHSKAVKAGAAFVGSVALNVARTQAQNHATKALEGILAKKAAQKAAKKVAGG